MRKSYVFTLGAALFAMSSVFVSGPAYAASCKTLKGEMVGFGENASRDFAESKLDKAISDWEKRTGKEAKPRNRTLECKVYIAALNEFECKAEAVVCR